MKTLAATVRDQIEFTNICFCSVAHCPDLNCISPPGSRSSGEGVREGGHGESTINHSEGKQMEEAEQRADMFKPALVADNPALHNVGRHNWSTEQTPARRRRGLGEPREAIIPTVHATLTPQTHSCVEPSPSAVGLSQGLQQQWSKRSPKQCFSTAWSMGLGLLINIRKTLSFQEQRCSVAYNLEEVEAHSLITYGSPGGVTSITHGNATYKVCFLWDRLDY